MRKSFFAVLLLSAAMGTNAADAPKISAMTKTNVWLTDSLMEISIPVVGGHVTRAIPLSQLFSNGIGAGAWTFNGTLLSRSNVFFTNYALLAATNSTANTNLTINLDVASSDVTLSNHASLTNIVGLAGGRTKMATIFITAAGGPYNLVWPTLGGPSFGGYAFTNVNYPMWSSVTNTLEVQIISRGTNYDISMTEWK